MKGPNETISRNRQGKDKVLKDIVGETRIYRRIYKAFVGFERIHKARLYILYDDVCTGCRLICKDIQRDTGLYNNIHGHTRRYKDIPGYRRIHTARCTCIYLHKDTQGYT